MAFRVYGLVLVMFVALGRLPDVEAKKIVCCLPNAFEISEYLLTQTVTDCKRHTVEGQCRVSLDLINQKSNLNCSLIYDGILKKFRILALAKLNTTYIIDGLTGKCYPFKGNITLNRPCIYSDFGFKLPDFYLGARPTALNVSAYYYNYYGIKKAFLSYVPGKCVPVEVTAYTVSSFFKDSRVDVDFYGNYTLGIPCPNCVFDVPPQCKNVTELAADEDTLFYEKFLREQQIPPFHWEF